MSDPLTIRSHAGAYTVSFAEDALQPLDAAVPGDAHFIIDRRVAEMYADRLGKVLASASVLLVDAVVKPLEDDAAVPATVLAMEIVDEDVFRNPDIIKIVHDVKGDVLYTSRSPIPFCEALTPEVGALRIYGIFAFRWHFLRWFAGEPESPLEIREACDSNRICDNGFRQRMAAIPYRPCFSVDSPEDAALVEAVMKEDALWGTY